MSWGIYYQIQQPERQMAKCQYSWFFLAALKPSLPEFNKLVSHFLFTRLNGCFSTLLFLAMLHLADRQTQAVPSLHQCHKCLIPTPCLESLSQSLPCSQVFTYLHAGTCTDGRGALDKKRFRQKKRNTCLLLYSANWISDIGMRQASVNVFGPSPV